MAIATVSLIYESIDSCHYLLLGDPEFDGLYIDRSSETNGFILN